MAMARKRLWIGLAVLVALLVAGGVAWNRREPIARELLAAYLAERGVPASYRIAAIGTQRQRLENVRLGDPANPDLTADWVEIDMGPGWGGLTVKGVRAKGVRLRGQIIEGWLSMGAVDKLLPAPTGERFALPDLDLLLEDARMQLGTPAGQFGIRLDGRGNAASGFQGVLAAVSDKVEQGGCAGSRVSAYGKLSTVGGRPGFDGPIRATDLRCQGVAAGAIAVLLNASASPMFDQWRGTALANATTISTEGIAAQSGMVRANFDGNQKLTRLNGDASFEGVAGEAFAATRFAASGDMDIGLAGDALLLRANGGFDGSGVRPGRALSAQLAAFGSSGAGTPVAPLVARLNETLRALAAGSTARGRFALEQRGGRGSLALSGLGVNTANGARLTVMGERPVSFAWPGGLTLAGTAQLSGGGLPTSLITLGGREGEIAGIARIAPWAAGTSRLVLTPVQFAQSGAGWRVDTVATLDGPVAGGSVTGLRVPIALRPGEAALAGCRPVGFRTLSVAGLRLAPAMLQTCISGGAVTVAAPRLGGRLGSSPIGIAAASARYGLANGDFTVDRLAVRLGDVQPRTQLDIARLSGTSGGAGIAGTFAGLSGSLANVPLLVDEGNGTWRLANSRLDADGAVRVADTAAERRFLPLVANDVKLNLIDGIVTATGTAREPASGRAVASVDVRHVLASGTGRANLAVNDLRFDRGLQPDTLTPVTLGVIAEAQGSVRGRGTIDWTPQGVRSTGRFRTDRLDFAAAFGPVTGLSGEIELSDLLGLQTGDWQTVRIGAINPGIAVTDGEVRYRLLSDYRIEVQDGRWPFAGGVLVLEPTVLDLSAAAQRRLTFRVEALDAARFIAALEFENIAATGIFDGSLPMIFDKNGGRIEGGEMTARGSGTLSYVGEISNENLGTWGGVAFDALKSLKYERLSIGLSGPLDGEVITTIGFKGVNQAPLESARRKIPVPVKIVGLNNFPFIFNIKIIAPFRSLFQSVRDVQDPTLLLERELPRLQRQDAEKSLPNAVTPVQTPESRP